MSSSVDVANFPATAQRIPALSGALNFRDLGGYETAGGGAVRWNVLYRSGTTHALTNADLEWLAGRGVRFAFDLRSTRERATQPNRLQELSALSYRFVQHDHIAGDVSRALRSSGTRRADTHRMMLAFYRAIPYTFKESYRALLLHIADGDLPLVFNCTAGKDRTGVAAALILSLLEVPDSVILADYLLTEQFFDQSCNMMLAGKYGSVLAGIERDVWEPLMRADAEYLQAMFEQVTVAHGSIAGYVESELGLSGGDVARLRANLRIG